MCLGQEQTEVVTASARPNVQVRGSLRPRTLQLSEHGRLAQILPCAALQNTESPDAVSEAVGPCADVEFEIVTRYPIVLVGLGLRAWSLGFRGFRVL